MGNAVAMKQSWQMTPTTLDEAMQYAKLIADSEMVPREFKGKPGNVLVAIQMGDEVGLKPLQALQSIAVINGRPSIWGDAVPGLCQKSPHYEWHNEYYDEEKQAAVCIVKRKGAPEYTYTFSMKDVVAGGYDKKSGPWQTERRRMMQMRARRAFRDQFADALKGLSIAEDVMDISPEPVVSTVVENKPQIESLKDKLKPSVTEAPPVEPEIIYDLKAEQEAFNAKCLELALSPDESKAFKKWLGFTAKTTASEIHAVNEVWTDKFDEWVATQTTE